MRITIILTSEKRPLGHLCDKHLCSAVLTTLLSRQVCKPYLKKGFFGPLSPTNCSFKYNRILLCFLLKGLSSKNQGLLTPPSQALTTGNTKAPTVGLRMVLSRPTPPALSLGLSKGGCSSSQSACSSQGAVIGAAIKRLMPYQISSCWLMCCMMSKMVKPVLL